MSQKERFKKIIGDVILENGNLSPWLKQNMEQALAEFDRRENTGTFHGVYRFLEDIKT
jgi:hypothetical protein